MPEITEADLEPVGAGVRAQAMTPDGGLVQDFEILERPDALHLLNAPSPAATAALAIGEEIVQRVNRTGGRLGSFRCGQGQAGDRFDLTGEGVDGGAAANDIPANHYIVRR